MLTVTIDNVFEVLDDLREEQLDTFVMDGWE